MRATRTFLEMLDPSDLHVASAPPGNLRLERLGGCPPSFYRYLYHEVGRRWWWIDRARWSDDEIRRHLSQPAIAVWLLSFDAAPAGYFELKHYPDNSVEIAYFGLLPEFVGRGLGRWLLSEATQAAWSLEPEKVWVHTSTLDHPAALSNYLARGFRVLRTEDYVVAKAESP
jgi:GNAT superfamily N-acetyltransferase